jgi:hypothetical protein
VPRLPKLQLRQTLAVPQIVVRDYLKWLQKPSGACFMFSVLGNQGVVDVVMPLVKTKVKRA